MLSDYANQTLQHEAAGTANKYNETTYGAAVAIKGRKEASTALIIGSDGKQVKVSAAFMTETEVKTGDRIDGRIVVTAEPLPGLDGKPAFYEGYTT